MYVVKEFIHRRVGGEHDVSALDFRVEIVVRLRLRGRRGRFFGADRNVDRLLGVGELALDSSDGEGDRGITGSHTGHNAFGGDRSYGFVGRNICEGCRGVDLSVNINPRGSVSKTPPAR